MPPRPKATTTAPKSTPAKKAVVAKAAAPVKKAAPAKASAPTKAVAAKKAAPVKAAEKVAPVTKSAPAKKSAPPVAKAPAAKKAAAPVAAVTKAAPTNKAPAKTVAAPVAVVTTAVKAAPAKKAPPRPTATYTNDEKFLERQKQQLVGERAVYVEQAQNLKAEAESLVEEMEPGDIQFDEESGEGGTLTVDRERDLVLSAQAQLAVEDIDDALRKITRGRYGICEGCGELISKPRLEAMPFARLCIACKSGGLSRR
jgi:RNA polymerase-binding transcription factor DksA